MKDPVVVGGIIGMLIVGVVVGGVFWGGMLLINHITTKMLGPIETTAVPYTPHPAVVLPSASDPAFTMHRRGERGYGGPR